MTLLVRIALLLIISFAAPGTLPSSHAAANLAGQTLPEVLMKRQLAGGVAIEYFLYVPASAGPGAPIFITVHGISRNAQEHALSFRQVAEKYGVVVIAPVFSREGYAGYQRLRTRSGLASDLVLEDIVAEVGTLTGARTDKLYLFGFSAGGQFVHRFAMAHPEQVGAYVVGAAGWYTFPDSDEPFPRGLRDAPKPHDYSFDPRHFLAIPAKVLVGERDVYPGTALRKDPDVTRLEGATRFDRGEHWVTAMNRDAERLGITNRLQFGVLERTPHAFGKAVERAQLPSRVFEFLFRDSGGMRVGHGTAIGPDRVEERL
jgi:pimeloyl-ACP methyl ester carboxylesterase